jgi:hypothetical protein
VTRGLPLFLGFAYGMIAMIDMAMCVSGRYAQARVAFPAFPGIQPSRGLHVILLLVPHAALLWWLLDSGAYGKLDLPGYLIGWFGFDSLARMYKLRQARL